MSKIYILERGYQQQNGSMLYFDKIAFKSKKDVVFYLENSYAVNKGFNKETEINPVNLNETFIKYDCLSTDNNPTKIHLKLTTLTPYYT